MTYGSIIGQTVHIVIDRPLGNVHPKHPDIRYGLNYGYVPGIMGGDGEEQDVYLMGVDEVVASCDAVVIAVIHRLDDVEDKWVAAPEGTWFTHDEIEVATRFQERFFRSEILTMMRG